MASAPEVPREHMAPWVRNARLYETLKGMGLFVTAVPFKDGPSKINWIQVYTQMPADTLEDLMDRMVPSDADSVPRHVSSPLQGAQIRDVVTPASADRDNVIDFPPVV